MKILVIGSGGREHALVWKISKSPLAKELYCAPGSAGMTSLAQCVNIPVQDISGLVKFAKNKRIDLTVVGPELPLTLGIVDEFKKEGLRIFGPTKEASQLEESKIFAKTIMKRYHVPTASFEVFSDYKEAEEYLKKAQFPVVLKADGLAAGKGVLVSQNIKEALHFADAVMVKKAFGKAGERLVVEECLKGEEISVFALMDGKNILPLIEARDHKRVNDRDQGLNTGGMGAYSPVDWAPKNLMEEVLKKVFLPILKGMNKEEIPYQGVLYAGLMLTEEGIKVLEFNVRFGDPETQVIMPRIKSDLVPLLIACSDGHLSDLSVELYPQTALCVVLASGGYPETYQSGYEIKGLENFRNENGIVVFHAGTKIENGKFLTHGGRVLGVTAVDKDMESARKLVYQGIEKIHFENMHYRRDIGLCQV